MTNATPDSGAPSHLSRSPSAIVLGADSLLAALPATPVQLAHACMRLGYHHVIPASWGDELIAAATLRELRDHDLPAVQCSCPIVARRLLAVGCDLRPFLISLVAPPVALARYLRAARGPQQLHITYVGCCPGAVDESIDAHLTPNELLAILIDRQVVLEEQPRVFDSVIPPDRRRFRSQPGGVPTVEALLSEAGERPLVELNGGEFSVELAQQLLSEKKLLVDSTARVGCFCSGAVSMRDAQARRSDILALEPPRSHSPVVDEKLSIDLSRPLPESPADNVDVIAPSSIVGGETSVGVCSPRSLLAPPTPPSQSVAGPQIQRRSPAHGTPRPVLGGIPTARDFDGRQLPRAYVARRRSTPTGVRAHADATPAPRPASVDPVPRPQSPSGPTSRDHAVDIPVAKYSDTPAVPSLPERPIERNPRAVPSLRLLLIAAALLSVIVIISAAIGVAAGRRLTQHQATATSSVE